MLKCLKNAKKIWKLHINGFGDSKNSLENAVKSLLDLPNIQQNLQEFQKIFINFPILSRESQLQQNFSLLYRDPQEFLQITTVFLDFLNKSSNNQINSSILVSFIRFLNDFLDKKGVDPNFKQKIHNLVVKNVNICDFQVFETNFQGLFKELFFLSLETTNFKKMDEKTKNLYFSSFPNIIKNCKDEEECRKLISFAISQKRNGKFLRKLISLKQWNIDDFYEFDQMEQKKKFYFRLRSCFSYWELEEFYWDSSKFLSILVKKLENVDENIAYSIFLRNNLSRLSCNKMIEKQFQEKFPNFTIIENPLIFFDAFKPLEVIILEEKMRNCSEKTKKNEILHEINQYFTLKDVEIDEKNVYFIDNCEKLEELAAFLLKEEFIGIDIENFEETPVLLQISTVKKEIFLLDIDKFCQNMNEKSLFYTFLSAIFKGSCKKLATGLHGDLNNLRKLGEDFKKISIKNSIDIQELFTKLFPNEKKSSLKFMVEKLLTKKLSKSENISNWKKRPLRRYQLHYASMDSFLMLKIYELLENK